MKTLGELLISRRNLIANRAISVLNGQKSCTRMMLTPKTSSNWNSRKFISKFREIVQTRVKFYHQCHFIRYFEVFHVNFKICFQHLVFLEMMPITFKAVAGLNQPITFKVIV